VVNLGHHSGALEEEVGTERDSGIIIISHFVELVILQSFTCKSNQHDHEEKRPFYILDEIGVK
jgi:hypothetical protein